jgi:cation diffusion facilitator CzcD-associated flavoprotein CzcO
MSERVVVVGAGPAGVAAAVALKDRRLRPMLLDKAEEVASAWRTRYDRLRLNTCRPYSHLPGRRFPKGTPKKCMTAARRTAHAAGSPSRETVR